jgi:putative oxidoreductase
MQRFLGKYSPYFYAFLRIIAGLLFASHGLQKLLGWFGGRVAQVGSLPWFAGIIELVAGLLIALGLFTAYAAFIASGQMAVAYFMVHHKNTAEGWHPVTEANNGEKAVLYCFLFLYIAAHGAGPLAIERWRRHRR